MPNFGVPELLIILVIVAMLFGVGKLPQVFGAVGKGIKEFRRESADVEATAANLHSAATTLPVAPATAGSQAPTVTTVSVATTAPAAPAQEIVQVAPPVATVDPLK